MAFNDFLKKAYLFIIHSREEENYGYFNENLILRKQAASPEYSENTR